MVSRLLSKVFACVVVLAVLGVAFALQNIPFVQEISEVCELEGIFKATSDAETHEGDLLPSRPPLTLPDGDGDAERIPNNQPARSTTVVAHLDGGVHLVDLKSGRSHWSLNTGPPLASFNQTLDGKYSAGLSEDGRLHVYSLNDLILKIDPTDKYMTSFPLEYENGSVLYGTTMVKTFEVNARTGEVIGPFCKDGDDNQASKKSMEDQGNSITSAREIGTSLQPSTVQRIERLFIKRTNYYVMLYEINELRWRASVSKIEAYFSSQNPPSCYVGVHYNSEGKVDMESENVFKNRFKCQTKVLVSHIHGPKITMNGLTYIDLGEAERTQLAVQKYSINDHMKELANVGAPEANTILPLMQKNEIPSYFLKQSLIALPSDVPSHHISDLALLPSNSDKPSHQISHLDTFPSNFDKPSHQMSILAMMPSNYDKPYRNISKRESVKGFVYYGAVIVCFALVLLISKLKSFNVELNTKRKTVVSSKKRKTRRIVNTKSEIITDVLDKLPSEVTMEAEVHVHAERTSNGSLLNVIDCSGIGGRRIDKIFVSNMEIAKGSNGTVVLKGMYSGRHAAIKRLVRAHSDVASKEVEALLRSDSHPNIVRWYGVEYDADFVYIALELCTRNLSDLVELFAPLSSDYFPSDASISSMRNGVDSQCNSIDGIGEIVLWKENGYPSNELLGLMRGMVSGLAHLHDLKIVHRDLKPHNVLISAGGPICAKLSDMGISKSISDGKYSLTNNATGGGSSGWQAPEILHRRSQSFAVDLFSLGCVLFFCITKGRHPFGKHFERDMNIANNQVDLSLVNHIPEAVHLFAQLLQRDPSLRPTAHEVLQHPLFWTSERRLSFLKDCSDRIELEDKEKQCDLIEAIEQIGPVVFGGSWDDKFDRVFLDSIGNHRRYHVNSMRHLLRLIRNKWNHYFEFPKEIQHYFGNMPEGEGYDHYLTKRFPKLFIEVYKVFYQYSRGETQFAKYFKSKNN